MDLSAFNLIPHITSRVAIGDTFGRWTVLQTGKHPAKKKYMAVCECTCGKIAAVTFYALLDGTSSGCGCGRIETITKHGLFGNPLYNIWHGMKSRCYNPQNEKSFPDYGGRGIKVCDRWQDVHAFIADMGPSYFKGATIERKNVNGDYEPNNCIWATRRQQSINRRSNIMISYAGKTQCLADWAEELGIAYKTLHQRIKAHKWSVERAFTTAPLTPTEVCELARAQCVENRAKK